MMSMQVHRMVIRGAEVTEPNSNLVSGFAYQGRSRRENFPVNRQNVEVGHFQWIWTGSAGRDVPFANHEREVAIDVIFSRRISWMDDKHADQTHAHLGHLIVMRVEHLGPVLP